MRDEFFLKHGGEIRGALLMIEGDDGGFELLAHGWLAAEQGGNGQQFALVRSCNTDRTHLLIRDSDLDPTDVYHWHRIGAAALRILQERIARLRPRSPASEMPVTAAQR
jgi:hypothetical protein